MDAIPYGVWDVIAASLMIPRTVRKGIRAAFADTCATQSIFGTDAG